jgi:hypothetical protein
MYVLTHGTPVDPSIPYAQRPEREVAFGHNVSKWRNAALAFEPSTSGEWEHKFWETADGVFEHMSKWNPRPIPNRTWGFSPIFEKDVAELIWREWRDLVK